MSKNSKNKIEQGIDEPLNNNSDTTIQSAKTAIHTLNEDESALYETKANFADRMEKHWYKKYGLNLMIGCGIAYIVLVLFDTITCNAWQWATSELMTGLIELLKFVVSTLIGFVFSESKKRNE